MKKLLNQILKFGIVGGVSFLADYLILIILIEFIHIYYLFSNGISFLISLFINYFLSMKFVFISKKKIKEKTKFLIFSVLSIIGLIINQLVMLFFVEHLGIHYTFSKIVATSFVMIYNFISRKLLLESQ